MQIVILLVYIVKSYIESFIERFGVMYLKEYNSII